MAARPLWAIVLQWTLWLVLMTAVMRWLGRTRERQTDGAGTLAHPRSTLIIGLVCTAFFLACADTRRVLQATAGGELPKI